MLKVVCCSGGMDPLHSGHIAYFEQARSLGDMLVIGLNSDQWLQRKKGRHFMPFSERFAVVSNLKMVDLVLPMDDQDNTASDLISQVLERFPEAEIIFANGGDRTPTNVPEQIRFADNPRVKFVFGVGGEHKQNSSSWILQEWKAPKTERTWGYYRVLHEDGNQVKLKELTVMPQTCLSMQRHSHRSEFWFVAQGEATVYTRDGDYRDLMASPSRHQHTWIELNEWHQLCNETDQPLKLIEIQYGDQCVEEDIERCSSTLTDNP